MVDWVNSFESAETTPATNKILRALGRRLLIGDVGLRFREIRLIHLDVGRECNQIILRVFKLPARLGDLGLVNSRIELR